MSNLSEAGLLLSDVDARDGSLNPGKRQHLKHRNQFCA